MKSLILAGVFFALFAAPLRAFEVKIETNAQGQSQLLRNGEPYLVKGANWPTPETVKALVDAGGNSVRTYGDEIAWMLPLAKDHNLSVMLGLHIGRERQGFDYGNQAEVAAQIERLRATVRRYKNAPEVLIWAIGNEPELHARNPIPMWKEVNRIARMIREEDPHHPIITVVAGFDETKIRQVLEHCPDLDALGVNWYGPATRWPDDLRRFGWKKPYLLTEFGPAGYWDGAEGGGVTTWKAPIEQHSTQKAALYAETWRDAVFRHPGRALGGYAFIWGPKQERTPTWFSMHLFGGERTASVDAMTEAWTGLPPKNPAPAILEWQPVRSSGEFAPGEAVKIGIRWQCDRRTKLSVEIRTESVAEQVGGDVEPPTEALSHTIWKSYPGGIEVTAPTRPGYYRIFIHITTEDKTAATANHPISIRADAKR